MATFEPPPRQAPVNSPAQECSNPQGADASAVDCGSFSAEERISPATRRGRPPAIPLRGVVQHYAWGKPSNTSIVARMATDQVRSRRGVMKAPPMQRGTRFAELWMGTHPNGHSSVIMPGDKNTRHMRRPGAPIDVGKLMQIQEECSASSDDEGAEEFFLRDVIEQDPVFWLGSEDAHRKNIPYLFKALSIQQALSIQAHPNKKLAVELHQRAPGHYPDDNHKPEICIPLGHFEALVGFRRIAEVRKNILRTPEMQALIGLNEEEVGSAPLSDLFSNLMNSDKIQQARQVVALVSRLKESLDLNRDEKLILTIAQDFPTDVGIFSVYFLNYVVITADMPNRFIYCAPDEPHAYLCGDAIECMAMSDNVVRAGLTPKYKDVETLLRMMTWRDDLLDDLVNVGERVAEHVVKYDPPVEDFVVYEIDGPVPEGIILPRAAISACIHGNLMVDFLPMPVEGEEVPMSSTWSWKGEKKIRSGHTLFSKAGTQMIISSADKGARLFIATY